MSSITFDTHKFVRKLQEAGFNQAQAEGLTDAMRAAIDETELVTRKDLQIELAPVHTELKLLKWMSTTNIALSIFLVGLVGKVLHLW
ncbi:MAG: DUF1640 domain-containing protein [Pseudomonadota bacterium]|nr:DUF1640 domain-containing protein [Pseudomonadota bacterium]MDP1905734.1 DUF1640 domain-containing protein [Pseudomonadota bacterium]MDP2351348.1 DUF1640 domain-containing protein [Pseudomonadota bacterium]